MGIRVLVPLKQIEYGGVWGSYYKIYPKSYFVYLRGTILRKDWGNYHIISPVGVIGGVEDPLPRPSSYPLLGPKYLLLGTIYPQLRVQGGSW